MDYLKIAKKFTQRTKVIGILLLLLSFVIFIIGFFFKDESSKGILPFAILASVWAISGSTILIISFLIQQKINKITPKL